MFQTLIYYYPYRAFGGQNIIVYSTRFVTRRAILLLLPGLCDKEGYTITIDMAVGTGGAGGAIAPPIFCQPKKFKSFKITTYKSVYSNKDKIGF